MGICSGTANVAKYKFVLPHALTQQALLIELYKNRITPLELDGTTESSSGWCDPFKATPEFTSGDMITLDALGKVLIGIRIDKKTIPAVSFRLMMAEALESLNSGSTKKRASKALRDAARDRVKSELLSKALPAVQMFSVVFDLQKQEILTDALSTSATELLVELIEKTFPGTILFPIKTGILGVDLEAPLDALFDLVPCTFGGAV